MIWLGVAIGVLGIALLVAIVVQRLRSSPDGPSVEDVDPLFAAGIALTSAGVVLATTVGTVMYVVMTVGLVVMAIGAHRTQSPHH